MSPSDASQQLEQIAREIDLVVYRLERPPTLERTRERSRLRRELDLLRERIEDVARGLG